MRESPSPKDSRMSGPCEVALSRRALGAVVVATVTGEIDIASGNALDQRLGRLLDAANFSRLVIDVSEVEFFGVPGARCLLRAQRNANRRGVELRVVTGPVLAATVLSLCDPRGVIEIEPSVDTACDLPALPAPTMCPSCAVSAPAAEGSVR